MAKTRESQIRASRKYREENTIQVNVEFNRKTDPDLYEAIKSYEGSRPAMIREALRRDLERSAGE